MIRKVGLQYRLESKVSHRNLGTFKTLKAAKLHEKQVNYFKYLAQGRKK